MRVSCPPDVRPPFATMQEVRSKKAVVVMVVDLTDASGTLMGRVRACAPVLVLSPII